MLSAHGGWRVGCRPDESAIAHKPLDRILALSEHKKREEIRSLPPASGVPLGDGGAHATDVGAITGFSPMAATACNVPTQFQTSKVNSGSIVPDWDMDDLRAVRRESTVTRERAVHRESADQIERADEGESTAAPE